MHKPAWFLLKERVQCACEGGAACPKEDPARNKHGNAITGVHISSDLDHVIAGAPQIPPWWRCRGPRLPAGALAAVNEPVPWLEQFTPVTAACCCLGSLGRESRAGLSRLPAGAVASAEHACHGCLLEPWLLSMNPCPG